MEIKILSPCRALCTAVFVKAGDLLTAESLMARLKPLLKGQGEDLALGESLSG